MENLPFDHPPGFLEHWQDALFFWSFVAFTGFIAWQIFSRSPRD